MVFLLAYIMWAGFFSVAGNYLALVMWLNIDANENQKTHVNKLTTIQGYKWLLVGIIISLGQWIASLGLAEESEKLLSIFDNYNTAADNTGSSIFIDLQLHGIESVFNYFVLTTVAAGGYIMGIFIMGEELNFSEGVASLSNQVTTAADDTQNALKNN